MVVAVTAALDGLGEHAAYAVRSSATAEDLPTASFAGQQDTYLNVIGPAAILQHISRCWASLFTERAVTYRLRNGVDHRTVSHSRGRAAWSSPRCPASCSRPTPSPATRKSPIRGSRLHGLGEALVSGLVSADVYEVRDGAVIAEAVGTKQLAIPPLPAGGTQEQAVDPLRQEQPALTDAQAVRLAQLGQRIERTSATPRTSNGAWSTMTS